MGNDQKMNCELKVSVNMKLQDGKMVNLTEVFYMPQAVKNILSVSRIISKGAMMGATQHKIIIKKDSFRMILDARKSQQRSMVFYLK